jgi:hypothetical protein
MSHQHHHHSVSTDDDAWADAAAEGVVKLTEAGQLLWRQGRHDDYSIDALLHDHYAEETSQVWTCEHRTWIVTLELSYSRRDGDPFASGAGVDPFSADPYDDPFANPIAVRRHFEWLVTQEQAKAGKVAPTPRPQNARITFARGGEPVGAELDVEQTERLLSAIDSQRQREHDKAEQQRLAAEQAERERLAAMRAQVLDDFAVEEHQ